MSRCSVGGRTRIYSKSQCLSKQLYKYRTDFNWILFLNRRLCLRTCRRRPWRKGCNWCCTTSWRRTESPRTSAPTRSSSTRRRSRGWARRRPSWPQWPPPSSWRTCWSTAWQGPLRTKCWKYRKHCFVPDCCHVSQTFPGLWSCQVCRELRRLWAPREGWGWGRGSRGWSRECPDQSICRSPLFWCSRRDLKRPKPEEESSEALQNIICNLSSLIVTTQIRSEQSLPGPQSPALHHPVPDQRELSSTYPLLAICIFYLYDCQTYGVVGGKSFNVQFVSKYLCRANVFIPLELILYSSLLGF